MSTSSPPYFLQSPLCLLPLHPTSFRQSPLSTSSPSYFLQTIATVSTSSPPYFLQSPLCLLPLHPTSFNHHCVTSSPPYFLQTITTVSTSSPSYFLQTITTVSTSSPPYFLQTIATMSTSSPRLLPLDNCPVMVNKSTNPLEVFSVIIFTFKQVCKQMSPRLKMLFLPNEKPDST